MTSRHFILVICFLGLTCLLKLIIICNDNNFVYRSEYTPGFPSGLSNYSRPKENVIIEGEAYVINKTLQNPWENGHRKGLQMLPLLYAHLPAIRAQYSSMSPDLELFIEGFKSDIQKRGLTTNPWELAKKWANPWSLVPEPAPGLGDILTALSTTPFVSADLFNRGSQFKITATLQGGQKILFKAIRHQRSDIIEGMNSGNDRHYAEIAAFHLSRTLKIQMVPYAVGRNLSVLQELLPVSTRRLVNRFYLSKEGEYCINVTCRFCEMKTVKQVCTTNGILEGAVVMWIPDNLPLMETKYPWRHYYKSPRPVGWERDENFCNTFLQGTQRQSILEMVDQGVLDFMVQNTDRHQAIFVNGTPNASIIPIDHGKGFGDPYVDYMDLLAPLLQCCRIHHSTYERLVLLSGGGMSRAMREILALDPIAPVLSEPHLLSLDRRVSHILAAIRACAERKGGLEKVIF